MASSLLVPVEEYLRTVYRPDCDYVNGEVLERNMGERSHGRLQLLIAKWLSNLEREFQFQTVVEVRLQVRSDRFRVPDIMLIPLSAVREKIITTPPKLCIEILSPEDTMTRTLHRVKEYFEMGVRTCWIIDPESREAWIATPGNVADAVGGILRAGEIEMPLAEVFEAL